jgi:cytochrome c556
MLRIKPLRTLPLIAAAGVLSLASAGFVFAAGMSAEQTIQARQGHLKDLGAAFKEVRDQLRKSEPDMAPIKSASTQIAKLVGDMNTWFPKGSGPESKIETDAKPEIWTDSAGFEKALKNMQAEAPKLQQLASANDVAGIKAQVGKIGAACKGCHDSYRVPQD